MTAPSSIHAGRHQLQTDRFGLLIAVDEATATVLRVTAKRLVGRSLPLFFHRHRAAIAEALRQAS